LDGPILTAPSDYLMFNNFFNKINNFIVIWDMDISLRSTSLWWRPYNFVVAILT
jgi:hypothetical protein